MNIPCMIGRTVGSAIAWNLVQTFLTTQFRQAQPRLRRLSKVALLETFGASERLKELKRKFGFEPDHAVTVADLLNRSQHSHASVAA